MTYRFLYALLSCLILHPALKAETLYPQVEFITPDIARIRWALDGGKYNNQTGVCIYADGHVNADTLYTDKLISYNSDRLIVEIDKTSGSLIFRDPDGRLLLSERRDNPREAYPVVQERVIYDESSARMEDTANGKVTVKDVVRRDTIGHSTLYRNYFDFQQDEALYGLGAHMEDYMNLNGKTLYLVQHNLKAAVPVLVSTAGYALLFDAGCAMKFEEGCIELEAAKTIDYYFIKAPRIDDAVAGYRYLTGKATMLPRYAFGYIQSKERYVSSDDILSTLSEYRHRHVPIDMIVQDWNYWPEGWGYLKMDSTYYPDPALLADSVHALNARLMISIWPNPQFCPQERDFREKGYMLEHSVYDVFNPDARNYYWTYVDKEFFSKGFDAWWCDSSEPLDGDWNQLPAPVNGKPYSWDDHERRWHLNKDILSDALGAERCNLYSLYHSMGIYENQRKATDKKRVMNLTRSTYAGQQRYGTVVWNGDTHASWKSLKQQIPAGLNYMATGNPYWTVDVGCFFVKSDPRWFVSGTFPEGVNSDEYKQFYLRMLQWAVFLPVVRSHGTDTPREIWHFGSEGSPYYDAILASIKTRYRYLPYIYSLAARQTFDDYTMARLLSFDFPHDKQVHDIKDQYMFGDILVCPVTDPDVDARDVYLPRTSDERKWIDLHSGQRYDGAQTITASAPLERIPLFVREGTILISADSDVEYADAQIGEGIVVELYTGADAQGLFYEDSGEGYGYEHNEYCRIPINWEESTRTLRLNDLQGSYPGMPQSRSITICLDGAEKCKLDYQGKEMSIQL